MEFLKYNLKSEINSKKMFLIIMAIIMIMNSILWAFRIDDIQLYYMYSYRSLFILSFIIPAITSIFFYINVYINTEYVYTRLKFKDILKILQMKFIICFGISTIFMLITSSVAMIYRLENLSIIFLCKYIINNTITIFTLMMLYDLCIKYIKNLMYSTLFFIILITALEFISHYMTYKFTFLEMLFFQSEYILYKLIISIFIILLNNFKSLKFIIFNRKNLYYIDDFNKKQFIIISILTGILYYFINIDRIRAILGTDFIFTTFVYLEFGNLENELMQLIEWMLPLIICILQFYNYMADDIINKSSLVLTRIKNRGNYIVFKSINLGVYVFSFIFIIFSIVQIFNIEGSMSIYGLKFMILIGLYFYIIILAINSLSIFFKSSYSLIIVLSSIITSFMIFNTFIKLNLNITLFKFNPFTSIYIKHLYGDMFSNNGYIISFMTLSVIGFIIIYLTRFFVKKVDIREVD